MSDNETFGSGCAMRWPCGCEVTKADESLWQMNVARAQVRLAAEAADHMVDWYAKRQPEDYVKAIGTLVVGAALAQQPPPWLGHVNAIHKAGGVGLSTHNPHRTKPQ